MSFTDSTNLFIQIHHFSEMRGQIFRHREKHNININNEEKTHFLTASI